MRVLILAYDFPPYVSVGGLRPYSWYRYLKEFGVEPVVVTRQWANDHGDERDYIAPSATDRVEVERTEFGTIVRAPHRPNLSERLLLRHGPGRHRLLRKTVTAWYEVGQYFADVGPKSELVRAARAYFREHGADVIIATGNPYVLFRYASELSREFGVPWVADYRDPWSQDHRQSRHRIVRSWLRTIERRIVSSAAAVTAANTTFRDLLATMHTSTTLAVIPNGYDPEAVAAAAGVAQDPERLTLAYTGSTYGWHPIESVLREIDGLNATRPRAPIHLRMIGVGGRDGVERMLRTRFPALCPRVSFTPRLPNDRMAAELARAHAFVAFNNYAYPGTKIYDYMALRRRILLCYSDDPEAMRLKELHYNIAATPGTDERTHARLIEATGSGTVVRDAPHLRQILEDLHREFTENRSIACRSTGIERFSRRTQAGLLADVLQRLVR